jgi:hypothetical protein
MNKEGTMAVRISMKVFLVFMVSSFILSMYGCNHYVGVEWVNEYTDVGKPDLWNRDDCATGFYEEIRAHPDWEGEFNRGDADAWEEHFKRASMSGTDSDWIDDVHFAYFAGHGAGSTGLGRGSAFTFGKNAHDNWILAAIPGNREPRWGDGRLNWIVLDVCSALAKKEDGTDVPYTLTQRWRNSDVMHGLHYILGFRTLAYDDGDRGRIFAEYLTGARDGTKYTVRQAWIKATKDTESGDVQGAYLRAYSSGSNTLNDHIYEHGWVSSDPDPTSQSYVHYSWPCN